jgi:hypothetical protein
MQFGDLRRCVGDNYHVRQRYRRDERRYSRHVRRQCCGSGDGISVANGATPNIGLTWRSPASSDWEFYDDAEWKAGQLNGFYTNGTFAITFTPDPGFGVLVNSFVFDDYAAFGGGNQFSWTLFENTIGGTVIASGGPTTTTDGQNLLVNTGMASGYFGPVVLRITAGTDPNAPTVTSSDAAIDDINFQQVPEPGTLVLAIGSLLGFAMVVPRKR